MLAEANVPDKQWRLGNYEILEEIGGGGMGVSCCAAIRVSETAPATGSRLPDGRKVIVRKYAPVSFTGRLAASFTSA
ncbi:MAG: hypothetical protein H0W66_08070 [Chthoniobacterales bacterium]|nr:hypothetical protein [Chthoniobacterales bacterium]